MASDNATVSPYTLVSALWQQVKQAARQVAYGTGVMPVLLAKLMALRKRGLTQPCWPSSGSLSTLA
jgi:hypothetical protein